MDLLRFASRMLRPRLSSWTANIPRPERCLGGPDRRGPGCLSCPADSLPSAMVGGVSADGEQKIFQSTSQGKSMQPACRCDRCCCRCRSYGRCRHSQGLLELVLGGAAGWFCEGSLLRLPFPRSWYSACELQPRSLRSHADPSSDAFRYEGRPSVLRR